MEVLLPTESEAYRQGVRNRSHNIRKGISDKIMETQKKVDAYNENRKKSFKVV